MTHTKRFMSLFVNKFTVLYCTPSFGMCRSLQYLESDTRSLLYHHTSTLQYRVVLNRLL